MWVLDFRGNAVNFDRITQLWTHDRSATVGVMAYEVNAEPPNDERDIPLFRGTEAECKAYIANLVERLNAPATADIGLLRKEVATLAVELMELKNIAITQENVR